MNTEYEQGIRKDQMQMANDYWGSASVIFQEAVNLKDGYPILGEYFLNSQLGRWCGSTYQQLQV